MSKVPKISARKTVQTILKQKRQEQTKLLKAKEAQEFDTFVRNTAKDMLKNSFNYRLQVFNADTTSKMPVISETASVWAPWSKLSD